MRKTRKRKLNLSEITKCNPRHKHKKECLPKNIYNDVSKKLKVSRKHIFQKIGCKKGEEHCLLDRVPLDDDLKKSLRSLYLRPRYPHNWVSDPDMWLDNVNIGQVMKQYQNAFSWFKFLGVFPIDFSAPNPYVKNDKLQCLYKDMCNINLKREFDNGTRGIGIVFNTDPHFKGGSHWVALYINLNNIKSPVCCYFDSYGYDVPPLIARLMRSFTLQIPGCKLEYNARRFQYGGSECGMFSMYFLICMIHGISFKEFCRDSVNDDFMLKLRHILFAK
jgi:hypothetical protein